MTELQPKFTCNNPGSKVRDMLEALRHIATDKPASEQFGLNFESTKGAVHTFSGSISELLDAFDSAENIEDSVTRIGRELELTSYSVSVSVTAALDS